MEGGTSGHLGGGKRDAEGRGSFRSGMRAKTVPADVGPVAVRARGGVAGTFGSAIVEKRRQRLSGADEMVLSLSAKGPTRGEISARLAEVHGASVSEAVVSTITGKVLDGMAEWSD
ncbi:transposase [Streptomyces clavuligerus]|uniref:transposase n=1 Tax=Streptomyces clavuligerus TaxID=1901 RepID=UPI000A307109|nr:transposase [Streptomyces clavuligerus]WDN57643.1 transposase [Streptomyces clavuligerus]